MKELLRIVGFSLTLILSMMLCGCSTKGNEISSESLQSVLQDLKSYEADVTITFLKDSQPNVLKMHQKVEIDGKYELEITMPEYLMGNKISYDGKVITQYHAKMNQKLVCEANEARDEVLLSSFINHYFEDSQAVVEESILNDVKVTTIQVTIPGDYKYMAKEKIWFDTKEKKPMKLEIYDQQGNVAIQVEFENVKYNSQIKWEM